MYRDEDSTQVSKVVPENNNSRTPLSEEDQILEAGRQKNIDDPSLWELTNDWTPVPSH